MIHGLRTFDLLRGHVMRRSHDLAFDGQAARLAGGTDDLRQAEIRDLHPALAIDQHVLRFDVAMHHALVVGVLQGVADLGNDLEHLAGR